MPALLMPAVLMPTVVMLDALVTFLTVTVLPSIVSRRPRTRCNWLGDEPPPCGLALTGPGLPLPVSKRGILADVGLTVTELQELL